MQYPEIEPKRASARKPDARERASAAGVACLSNLELVMLLLGSGTKNFPVAKIARNVLEEIMEGSPERLDENLRRIKGMGAGKSALISAALELGRRLNGRDIVITKATDILPLVGHYALDSREHFLCATLNGANALQKIRLIGVGTLNCSLVHPREVFSDVLVDRAAAVIICHNHPSGNTEPSDADIEATMRLKQAAEILGIRLLDHIVFSTASFYSFHDKGLL